LLSSDAQLVWAHDRQLWPTAWLKHPLLELLLLLQASAESSPTAASAPNPHLLNEVVMSFSH
jgi:hypothetical protein